MEVSNNSQGEQIDSSTQNSLGEESSKQKGYFLPILVTIVVLLIISIGGYYLYQKQTQSTPSSTTSQNPLSELAGIPIYPGASFVKQEAAPNCTDLTKQNEAKGYGSDISQAKAQMNCDSSIYTFNTNAGFDKVVSWYTNDESQSGWKLSGGAGAAGSSRYGTLSNGTKDYMLSIGLDNTTDKQFTTFRIKIPTNLISDETANWKTYTNTNYNFSLKYDPTSEIQESTTGGTFSLRINSTKLEFNRNYQDSTKPYQLAADNENYFWLEVTKNIPNTDVTSICNTMAKNNKITIDRTDGYYSEGSTVQGGGQGYSKTICIIKGDFVYMFLTEYIADSPQTTKTDSKVLFDTTLSSFKLTDQTSNTPTGPHPPVSGSIPSNWQTYTNATYGYSISYPDSYYVPPQSDRQKSQLGLDRNVCIELKSNTTCYIPVNASSNTQGYSLQDWINNNAPGSYRNAPNTSVNLNGYIALKYNVNNLTTYYISHNSNIYQIDIPIAPDPTFNIVLASFKFTN